MSLWSLFLLKHEPLGQSLWLTILPSVPQQWALFQCHFPSHILLQHQNPLDLLSMLDWMVIVTCSPPVWNLCSPSNTYSGFSFNLSHSCTYTDLQAAQILVCRASAKISMPSLFSPPLPSASLSCLGQQVCCCTVLHADTMLSLLLLSPLWQECIVSWADAQAMKLFSRPFWGTIWFRTDSSLFWGNKVYWLSSLKL